MKALNDELGPDLNRTWKKNTEKNTECVKTELQMVLNRESDLRLKDGKTTAEIKRWGQVVQWKMGELGRDGET